MEIKPRTVEITVISGENLRIKNKRPVKKNAFVTVRSDSHNYRTTKIDTKGGSKPTWNEKFVMDMPMHVKFITVEVKCKNSSGNKVVGTVRIPVTDFVGGFMPESCVRFLSYRLREGDGERNGIINISVRVKMVPEYVGGSVLAPPCLGIPVGEKGCGGVVTGVPVWYRYPIPV